MSITEIFLNLDVVLVLFFFCHYLLSFPEDFKNPCKRITHSSLKT